MNWFLRASLVRLLTVALLLVSPYSVSKIVCVSPTGHEALEDPVAVCCVPGAPIDAAFSTSTPCQGCTDYPLNSSTEIKSARTGSNHASWYGDATSLAAEILPSTPVASLAVMHYRDDQVTPLSSRLQTSVLRC